MQYSLNDNQSSKKFVTFPQAQFEIVAAYLMRNNYIGRLSLFLS